MTDTKTLILGAMAVSLIAASSIHHASPALLWNASASVPVGLYRTERPHALGLGEIVVVRPPGRLAAFLDRRDYLPRGVPLLKRVAALPGQRVCRVGAMISIDRRPIARALNHDRRGRPLPGWSGCFVLDGHSVFLLNRDRPDSLDGRYFGALASGAIVARAIPIWTMEAPR